MDAERAWKEHLELDEKLNAAELRFARAIIDREENRRPGPVHIGEIAKYHKEVLFSKCEMKNAEQSYIKNCEYLDSINFAP